MCQAILKHLFLEVISPNLKAKCLDIHFAEIDYLDSAATG